MALELKYVYMHNAILHARPHTFFHRKLNKQKKANTNTTNNQINV